MPSSINNKRLGGARVWQSSGADIVKIFALVSLLAAVINILFHNYLFYKKTIALDASYHDKFHFHRSINSRVEEEVVKNTTSTINRRHNNKVSCFRARNDTVPISQYGKLKPPYINLGFPKMASTSIHSFFACAGYRAMHYRCDKDAKCSDCIEESVKEGLPPFAKCGKADVYSQIDDGSWGHFPQMEYLEELISGVPNATFFLTFRTMQKWYYSLTHWPPGNQFGQHMSDGLRKADIKGFPSGKGKNQEEFEQWFCTHVQMVRDIVAKNPSQTLVEINLEDPDISSRLSDIFDVDDECWGHQNINTGVGITQTKRFRPWFVRGKTVIRGKHGVMRQRLPLGVSGEPDDMK